jgi:hypothetical protein
MILNLINGGQKNTQKIVAKFVWIDIQKKIIGKKLNKTKGDQHPYNCKF